MAAEAGDLRQSLDDPTLPHIAYRRGAAGQPTPIIRGTGIRVQTIVIAAQQWKLTPSQVAAEYDLTQVHRREIDAAIMAEETLEQMRERNPV